MNRVELKPGKSRRVEITANPRLLARYDGKAKQCIAEGTYHVALGKSSGDLVLAANVSLKGRQFGK